MLNSDSWIFHNWYYISVLICNIQHKVNWLCRLFNHHILWADYRDDNTTHVIYNGAATEWSLILRACRVEDCGKTLLSDLHFRSKRENVDGYAKEAEQCSQIEHTTDNGTVQHVIIVQCSFKAERSDVIVSDYLFQAHRTDCWYERSLKLGRTALLNITNAKLNLSTVRSHFLWGCVPENLA
jgi:hypothetical protein